jgi:uncharacterized linocin/CFP29 family protein
VTTEGEQRREETMDVLGRDNAPFSGRVWQQIDAAVNAVKQANCTARRFLEVDGPYGLGLTSLAGDDLRVNAGPPGAGPGGAVGAFPGPGSVGATAGAWGVRASVPLVVGGAAVAPPGADPDEPWFTRGTYLVQSPARPVPMVTSEFVLGIRNVESFDDECQPLDCCRATLAARDVALEEERVIFYGVGAALPGLLTAPAQGAGQLPNRTNVNLAAGRINLFAALQLAIEALSARGFAGPYALAAHRQLYTELYGLIGGTTVTLTELLRALFAMGVHMVPVIGPSPAPPPPFPAGFPPAGTELGVIVTCSRPYVRLVVGQDWTTAYRGTNGVYHRFVIASSLCLDICAPDALQVLVAA